MKNILSLNIVELTRSDTNCVVQPQKMARSLNFQLYEVEGCTIYIATRKALISCVVTAQLICAFVFTYAESRFFMMQLK